MALQDEFWEDNNPAIAYSPGGQWARSYASIYHGSTVMRTRKLGDSMSVDFEGSTIRFMGAQGWDHGSFLVNLDGEETIIDGYCCGTGGGVPQVIQFEATNLGTGSHTLNITNFAAGPYGTVFEVDAVLVSPNRSFYPSSFSLVVLIFLIALSLAGLRRRLRRLASTTATSSYQLLPTAIPPSSPVAPPPRRDKGMAASSKQQGDEPHSSVTAGASGSGSCQEMPPNYTPASRVDDELVDRIAQRVARLVQQDAPPTYEAQV
ncbi:hypothetical protein C8R46DRAFT_438904 [Mycena filopes]|nr:hypothetical protein C8R46DRAFT_438904 [Mycena filopes]